MIEKVISNEPEPVSIIPDQPKHSHKELWEAAEELKKAIKVRDPVLIFSKAESFYLKISSHITMEEGEGGLYNHIEDVQPQTNHRLKHLRGQHERILNNLKIILASDINFSLDTIAFLVRECLDLVLIHEKEEEILITDVFYTDLTAMD